MEEDAGEEVFGGVDGHGGLEEAGVAFEGVESQAALDAEMIQVRLNHGLRGYANIRGFLRPCAHACPFEVAAPPDRGD